MNRLPAAALALLLALCLPVAAHAAGREGQVGGQPVAQWRFHLRQRLITVKVAVGGGPALRFIIDSGASRTLLSRRAARRLGLRARVTRVGLRTATQQTVLSMAGPVTFDGEGLEWDLPRVGIVALNAGDGIGGILGADFLRMFVVHIDYQRRLLELWARGSYHAAPGDQVLPLHKWGRLDLIAARLPQGGIAHLLLDTGFSGAVQLNHEFARSHPKLVQPPFDIEQREDALGGRSAVRRGELTYVRLGRFQIPDLDAAVSTARVGELAQPEIDGLLGEGVLRLFAVALDMQGGRLILTPLP